MNGWPAKVQQSLGLNSEEACFSRIYGCASRNMKIRAETSSALIAPTTSNCETRGLEQDMRNLFFVAAITAATFGTFAQPFEFHTTLISGPTGSGSSAVGHDLNQHYPGNNPPESFPPITLDTDANTLRLPIGWGSDNEGSDLESDYEESWLYRVNGGTPEDLYRVDGFPGVYSDQTSGGRDASYDKTVTLMDVGSYTVDQQEMDIRNGLWFLRVDSAGFPNGEIAGQLTPVPEPEHYALMVGLGLAGFAVYRRGKNTQRA